MNTKLFIISIFSVFISGCNGSDAPKLKDIEPQIKKSLANYCEYATASNFEKINGFEEKDRNGNLEYMVEFKYDLTVKANNEWRDKYYKLNSDLPEINKSILSLNQEITKISNEAKDYIYTMMERKSTSPYSYSESIARQQKIYIDTYKKYHIPLEELVSKFIEKHKKWEEKIVFRDFVIDSSYLLLSYNDIPHDYKMTIIKIPSDAKERFKEIPIKCIGAYERDSPLKFFRKELIYLTKLENGRSYEPEIAESFIRGVSKTITIKAPMRKTENGWVFK